MRNYDHSPMPTSEFLSTSGELAGVGGETASVAVGARAPALIWNQRWLIVWATAVTAFVVLVGLPTSRPQIFVIIVLGLIASTIGTDRNWKRVVVDFLPFYRGPRALRLPAAVRR